MNGMEKEIVEVALDDIIPNRFQPRLSFDEQALNDLAESIRQHGIIQPLVLRKVGNKYEIIAGERRYKASYIAGLTKVPAVIINLNDNESAEVAIVENLQRQDLSAIEEAKSYKKLLDRGYLTQDQLATRMGKTQATISNKLRLLNLDQKVQDALLNNQISERHARSLLRLENKQDQVEMLNEIISKRLNVRATEDAINRKLNGEPIEELKEDISIPKNNFDTFNTNIVEPDLVSSNIKNDTSYDKPESFFDVPLKNTEEKSQPDFNLDELDSLFLKTEPEKESNPIPYIRPVIDNNKVNPVEQENLIEPFPKQLNESTLPFNLTNNKDISIVENKIQNMINELSEIGFKIKLEQYDFEKIHQFVIKVDKD